MSKIALLLTPGFADWEYAFLAGTGGPYYGADIRFFAPEAGPVISMGGLTAQVPQGFDEVADWAPDAVIAVGGTIWETEQAPDISALLSQQHIKGTVIGGICGGTLALARAGLLNSVPHTSNALEFLQKNAEGYTGTDAYVDCPEAVSDNRIVTAAGTAPVSFTAEVYRAIGIPSDAVSQFTSMLQAEHM